MTRYGDISARQNRVCPCQWGRYIAAHALPQHGAAGKGNGVAVEVDGAVAHKAGDGAAPGEGPDTAAADGDDRVIADGIAALGVAHDVDGAGEAAAVCQGHVWGGDGVRDDAALQGLGVRGRSTPYQPSAGQSSPPQA
mgnify:CR=1 FL=1